MFAGAATLGYATNEFRPVTATNPAAVFVAPLAGVAGDAGMLLGCLSVILRDVDLAG